MSFRNFPPLPSIRTANGAARPASERTLLIAERTFSEQEAWRPNLCQQAPALLQWRLAARCLDCRMRAGIIKAASEANKCVAREIYPLRGTKDAPSLAIVREAAAHTKRARPAVLCAWRQALGANTSGRYDSPRIVDRATAWHACTLWSWRHAGLQSLCALPRPAVPHWF